MNERMCPGYFWRAALNTTNEPLQAWMRRAMLMLSRLQFFCFPWINLGSDVQKVLKNLLKYRTWSAKSSSSKYCRLNTNLRNSFSKEPQIILVLTGTAYSYSFLVISTSQNNNAEQFWQFVKEIEHPINVLGIRLAVTHKIRPVGVGKS